MFGKVQKAAMSSAQLKGANKAKQVLGKAARE